MKPIVASICQKHLPASREALLFHKENGESFTQAGSPFRRAVKLCRFNDNITDPLYKVVFYTLRHTFASWLVMQGVPLYSVGKILGHKTTIMTQRYAHEGYSTDIGIDYKNIISHPAEFNQHFKQRKGAPVGASSAPSLPPLLRSLCSSVRPANAGRTRPRRLSFQSLCHGSNPYI